MKATFVLISVGERVPALNALVESIMRYRRFDKFDLNLYFSGTPQQAAMVRNQKRFAQVFVVPERMGCHASRVLLLRELRYDFYVNLDDDMLLTEHTDYSRALAKAAEPRTGFVLTNWAKTEALLAAKVPKMAPKFVPQVLVYQGGGMVYRDAIAGLMRALPPIKQTFDHCWPLTAYVNGYQNYRDLSSLAVHRVMGVGGMSAFMDANPPQLMMQDLIRFRRAKRQRGNGHDILIPIDSDLLPKAHELHRQNRK